MSVVVLLWICTILKLCLASLNAKYDIFQEDRQIETDFKIHMGLHYIDPYFTGVKINRTNLNNQGLTRNWNLQGSFEPGYVYMVKTFQEEVYLNAPRRLFTAEGLKHENYFTFIPGIPDAGTRLIVRFTLVEPWHRFTITIMNSTTRQMPFKMKIDHVTPRTLFCYVNNKVESGFEQELNFPFMTNVENKVEIIILSSALQVRVNDEDYYMYSPGISVQVSDSLCIWFEDSPDQLYLNSVQMFMPSMHN